MTEIEHWMRKYLTLRKLHYLIQSLVYSVSPCSSVLWFQFRSNSCNAFEFLYVFMVWYLVSTGTTLPYLTQLVWSFHTVTFQKYWSFAIHTASSVHTCCMTGKEKSITTLSQQCINQYELQMIMQPCIGWHECYRGERIPSI